MLHSKVYYMELPGGSACAFVGSNNVTSFALGGQNVEAAILLEGPATSVELDAIRARITSARSGRAVHIWHEGIVGVVDTRVHRRHAS